MTRRLAPLAICTALAFAPVSVAQTTTLVGFDFTQVPNNGLETSYASTTNNFTTATTISRGAGATTPATGLTNSITAAGFDQSSLANAQTANDYFTFTVDPTATITLQSANITFQRLDASNSPDSLALVDVTTSTVLGQDTNLSNGQNTNITVNFDFTDFAISTPHELRIYVWNGTTGNRFALTNSAGGFGVQVIGVPEAQTYVLAGLGVSLVGVGYWRKRGAQMRLAASALA
jgi:hypothetical protein